MKTNLFFSLNVFHYWLEKRFSALLFQLHAARFIMSEQTWPNIYFLQCYILHNIKITNGDYPYICTTEKSAESSLSTELNQSCFNTRFLGQQQQLQWKYLVISSETLGFDLRWLDRFSWQEILFETIQCQLSSGIQSYLRLLGRICLPWWCKLNIRV